MTGQRVSGSFRDPSGFLFYRDGTLYRQVNHSYRDAYDQLMGSGLYAELVRDGLLIPHDEVSREQALSDEAYRVLRPEPVHFVSYPYCWCFSQLRDAALITLELVRRGLAHGLILKDASAYNIQFHQGRPLLIDTLSFEPYQEGAPWIAYRQFCQHFLAPLLLMSQRDVRLGALLRVHLDGIPLDLASALLPRRTWLRFSTLLHLHLHAISIRRFEGTSTPGSSRDRRVRRTGLLGLLDSLESTIRGLRWQPVASEWAEYATEHNYSEAGWRHKQQVVHGFLSEIMPRTVWDLGANSGAFSRLAAELGAHTVAIDGDPAAVERAYLATRASGERRLLPLLMDLTNPSPDAGWGHIERMSLAARGPADVVLALALVHHLAISNNVPLADIAQFFARLAPVLIIEFVPKSDPQLQRLLRSRADIFSHYTREGFEAAFGGYFEIRAVHRVEGSDRVLYKMVRH